MDGGKALSDAKIEIMKVKRKITQEKDEKLKSELKNRLELIETTKFANQNINRIIRIIIDGIAWRNLDYQRTIFRLMAEHRPTGRIDINDSGFKGVLNLADAIMLNRKSIVIINDLTNFIRIGDLTEKYRNNIFVHESKRKGKRIVNIFTLLKDLKRNWGMSKQSYLLLKVQTAITHKKIFLEDGKIVNIRDINIKFKNHLKKVKGIIKKAKRRGFYSEMTANYLIVSCMDIIKAVKIVREKKCKFEDIYRVEDVLRESDFVLSFQNLDFFYRNEEYFIPNMTPYSVFPFSSKICYELMNGRLLLSSRLNITELCKVFRNNGWEVELIDVNKFLKRTNRVAHEFPNISKMFERDETICILKKERFNLGIPAMMLFRVGMDFMDAETLLKEVETIYNLSVPDKNEWILINNLGEKKVWN